MVLDVFYASTVLDHISIKSYDILVYILDLSKHTTETTAKTWNELKTKKNKVEDGEKTPLVERSRQSGLTLFDDRQHNLQFSEVFKNL